MTAEKSTEDVLANLKRNRAEPENNNKHISADVKAWNSRMPNGTYGGVRGRKRK